MSQHTPYVPHHRLGRHATKGDDLRHLFTAVALGDVLDHPIAAIHAEIDIEIRHGHALGVQESLEQQVVGNRVDVGDLQHIGHQGARAGTTPRPHRYVIALGPANEVRNDQEVARKAHLDDDVELMLQTFVVDLTIRLAAVVDDRLQALLQALLRLGTQEALDRVLLRHRKIRQIRRPQRQCHVAAPGDLHGVVAGLGQIREQAPHILG